MGDKPATRSFSPEGKSLPRRRWRSEGIYLAVLACAVLVCWIPRLKGPIDLRWDGGAYYVLGTSLASGRGYTLLNEPGNIEANQYPPLLPAIIAAHQLVLGTNDPVIVGRWLRMTYFLIFSLYVLTIYLMARGHLPPRYALLAAVICVLSIQTYFLSDLCFPELPFALATTLFVLSNRNANKQAYGIFATLFAVAAYALRTTGIVLLAAWVGESVFKKDLKRAALRSAVLATALFSWLFYVSAVETGQGYRHPAYEYQRADYLFYNVSYTRNMFQLREPFAPEMGAATVGDIAARFLHNLAMMPVALGDPISSKRELWEYGWNMIDRVSPLHLETPLVVDIVLMTLGFLILGGIVLQLTRRQWLIPLYTVLSVLTMCLTPWPQQFTRYLMPLAPFLTVFFFTMLLKIQELSRNAFPRRWRAAGQIFTGVVVLLVLTLQAITFYLTNSRWHQQATYTSRSGEEVSYRLYFYTDAQRAFDAGIDWLRSRAKPDDVVASSMPHWVYVRSGLKSVMPPFERDPAQAQRLLDTVPVSYLILDDGLALDTRKYTLPVAQTFADRWRRVYSDSVVTGFEIYERVH